MSLDVVADTNEAIIKIKIKKKNMIIWGTFIFSDMDIL